MQRLLVLLLIIGFSSFGKASEYSVIIQNIPRPVTIEFPAEFRPASSPKEYQVRNHYLDSFRHNPGFKSHYNELLLRDWSATSSFPFIVVGSLATTDRFQGEMSIKFWQDFQKVVKEANKKLIGEWRQKGLSRIEAGSGGSVKIANDIVWLEEQNAPDSIVLLSQTQLIVNGAETAVISGKKTIYFNGFVIFVEVKVDASKADALNLLKEFLNTIRIKSI